MAARSSRTPAGAKGRWAAVGTVVLLAAAWAGIGVRRIDPGTEFGIVESLWSHGAPRLCDRGRFAFAPPGASRFTRFSRAGVELTLPHAKEAMLEGADGGRFGLRGTAVVRALPERAADLASAAEGKGLQGVVLAAARASANVVADADREERTVSPRVHAFEKRLADELAARGVNVESLHLEGFEDLVAEPGAAAVPKDVKVLLIGLDGADWTIVDPLMAAGKMPQLARLVAGGVRSDLLSITPMLSPVIWTSIATGVEPSRHGILDFLAPAPSGANEPVTSSARRVPAVWDMLSDAGAHVGITGWWATWPADPVTGYMVTDRVAYQLFGYSSDSRSAGGKTWPAGLYDAVRPLIATTDAIPWSEVESYLDGPRKRLDEFSPDERDRIGQFRTLLAAGKTYLDVALAMRQRDAVQFESVYFEGTDTVGHLFMSFRPPQLPSVDPNGFASFRSIVDRYYENADRMLGKLLEGREGWTVIVVSDHGFASDATRPLTTDSRIGHGAAADWHRRFGVFVMNGPDVKRGVRLEKASVYDIAPTVLALFQQPVPKSWPGRVLGSAFTPGFLAAHPVRLRADDPARRAGTQTRFEDEQESAELRQKLESLGYLAPSAAQPMTTKNNKGVGLLAAGKYAEAASFFRQALADQPNHATLMVNLGIALRFGGELREAKELFEKAFATDEGRRAAGQQLAQLAMDERDFDRAERVLRSVLERERGAAEIHNALGLVLEQKGRFAESASEYDASARLDANAAEPRNNLGNLAKRDRRIDESERWYLAAIAADPYSMGAYNNLALLCQERGQVDRAIDLYGRALAKAPNNAVVMNNLASLYFATGENREARTLWRKATEADPKYASPLNNLAGMALSEGDDAAASELLDRALALDPKYGDARINRSLVARRRGDLDTARRELHEAAKDPRAAATARLHLGFLELEAGRPAEASEELEAARGQLGERTDLLNALGDAYARLKDTSKCLAAFKQSLAIDPRQDAVRAVVDKLEKHQ